MAKPEVESSTVITKKVTMSISEEEAQEIIKAYVIRHHAQFRGTDIKVDFYCGYDDLREITVTGTKETRR